MDKIRDRLYFVSHCTLQAHAKAELKVIYRQAGNVKHVRRRNEATCRAGVFALNIK